MTERTGQDKGDPRDVVGRMGHSGNLPVSVDPQPLTEEREQEIRKVLSEWPEDCWREIRWLVAEVDHLRAEVARLQDKVGQLEAERDALGRGRTFAPENLALRDQVARLEAALAAEEQERWDRDELADAMEVRDREAAALREALRRLVLAALVAVRSPNGVGVRDQLETAANLAREALSADAQGKPDAATDQEQGS